MKKPSRFLRILGVAGLMISLLAATVAPVAAQPAAPAEGLEWLFELNDGEFRTGDNAIYYPWVANGEDFGLGPSQTSISIQNLENIDTTIGIFVGDGAGDFTEVTTAFLSAWASKTFSASDLGIAEGSGAPVAVLAVTEIELVDEDEEVFPGIESGTILVETVVILSKPEGVEGDFTQVLACVTNFEDGRPAGFRVAADFGDFEAGDWYPGPFTSGELQEILEDAQDGGELVNPFGGGIDDGDCDDTEIIVGEGGETLVVPVVIGGVAKQAAAGATLPATTEADTAVSGYNALNGSEVFQFDEWYLPIVQTNCGPGGCWDTVIRVANVDGQNNAVTIRFFPADDGSGSLQTGFQIQDNVDGGETWNVNLGDLVPDGWVGTAHILSDGAVFAMADRYKVGYNMWITNTGSSADFENVAQVDGANGRYALFAPHVLMDYFGWNTGINVANLVNADNNVSIQYFNMFGNATQVLNQRLAAHGMTYFYDPSVGAQDNNEQPVAPDAENDIEADPNAGTVGSAIIWSESPVAAAVDATKYPESDPNGGEDLFQATSYSATQNVFTWQAVPLVQKGAAIDGMGDTSGINIMNPNAVAVTAEVYWVNPSGFLADNFGVGGVTIPGYANGFVYTLWQHNLPNGFTGAAQVIASQPVAAVSANVNYEVDGDGSAIFNAFNPCGFFRVAGECNFGDPFEPGGQSVTKTFLVDDGDGEEETVVGDDAEGIPGVDFSIISTDGSFQRDGVSGTEGTATFSNVPVGTYELFVNDVPGDYELPEGAVDQFVVTEGQDVVLINELELNQGFEKTVCVGEFDEEAYDEIVDSFELNGGGGGIGREELEEAFDEWLDEGGDISEFFFCTDINLAGVQVVVFEVTGFDVELDPVVDLDPVFVGETGPDGTVAGDLPSGDYILCLYKGAPGGPDANVITTVPGGEEVEINLFPDVPGLRPCFSEDPADFEFDDVDPDAGDYFVVEPGEVTELENPVFIDAGILNVLILDDTLGGETPADGIIACLSDGNDVVNPEDTPEACGAVGADGSVTFVMDDEGDNLDEDDYDIYLFDSGGDVIDIVDYEGGEDTVSNIVEVGGPFVFNLEFDYDPMADLGQDGFLDDDGVGTYDLTIWFIYTEAAG